MYVCKYHLCRGFPVYEKNNIRTYRFTEGIFNECKYTHLAKNYEDEEFRFTLHKQSVVTLNLNINPLKRLTGT